MTAALTGLYEQVDEQTRRILDRRRDSARTQRRGWLIRRALLTADLVGLSLAFLLAQWVFEFRGPGTDRVSQLGEFAIFLITLPGWIVVAKLYGLYERDEERTDHTTVEDMVDVFHLMTVGVWLLYGMNALTHVGSPTTGRLFVFWGLGIALVAAFRIGARTYCRRQLLYLQNTLIVGAGDVGQLVARKLLQHHEYGINLVGFVDDNPRERREDLASLAILGVPDDLAVICQLLDVERVVFAFSNEKPERELELVRSLDHLDVQIDMVPRLFEIVTPTANLHLVEGLPVLSLSPVRLSRSSRAVKRGLDVIVSAAALLLLAPLFAVIAWKIRRESPGPVFFRQERLGLKMKPFTVLKFRTMVVDTPSAPHEQFIRDSARGIVPPEQGGLFKLDRSDYVTGVGGWLRRTSLDELPQLINVLRGEMSLVGPRPCLAYELDTFKPHHFERFAVPAGMTGMWQVMARAHSSFREALDMDVAYVRGWSLGLDLQLLCRTPLQLLRPKGTR